ncbi:hypothetical protein [Streptomyces wuyuanensis]|uniref:hypothetical protein n=1 Tax=Streptomyces wuyuanensis TaxID=1196353 RepID=UPI0037993B28
MPTTIVDGRALMRDRRLLTLDVDAVATELAQRLPEPAGRAHGRRVRDHDVGRRARGRR